MTEASIILKCGISKANRAKLFNIDQSYSTTRTQNEKGIGLGLKILIAEDYEVPEMLLSRYVTEFCKEIVIIIAQTAYGHTGDRVLAIKAGCNSYITKPVNKTELLALIGHHFSK